MLCKVCGESFKEVTDYVPYGDTMVSIRTYVCKNGCDEEAHLEQVGICEDRYGTSIPCRGLYDCYNCNYKK